MVPPPTHVPKVGRKLALSPFKRAGPCGAECAGAASQETAWNTVGGGAGGIIPPVVASLFAGEGGCPTTPKGAKPLSAERTPPEMVMPAAVVGCGCCI